MAQPFDQNQTGISLWSLEDIEAKQQQQRDQLEQAGDKAMEDEQNYYAGLEDAALVEGMMAVDA